MKARIGILLMISVFFSSCGDGAEKGTETVAEEVVANEELPQASEEAPEYLYLFKDFFSEESGIINHVFASNGERFFFSTINNSTRKSELWVSDGTLEGTRMLGSFDGIESRPLSGSQSDYAYLNNGSAAMNSRYFFFKAETGSSRKQLFATDGTEEGTRQLMGDLSASGSLYAYNDKVYFQAYAESPKGRLLELFETDGEEVVQITSNHGGNNVRKIVESQGNLYFVPEGENPIMEWNGSSLREVFPSFKAEKLKVFPNGLEAMGDYLYFYAFTPRGQGFYYGNSKTGHYEQLLFHPNSAVVYNTISPHVARSGSKVYFAAPGPSATKEDFTGQNIKEVYVWKVDSAFQISQVKRLEGDREYPPYVRVEFSDEINDRLFFEKLHTPEGEPSGEIFYSMDNRNDEVAILDTLRGDFQHYYQSKTTDHLYFGGTDYNNPKPLLWRTDGTPEGTMSFPIEKEYKYAGEGGIAVLGNKIFLVAYSDKGKDIWVFDEEAYRNR